MRIHFPHIVSKHIWVSLFSSKIFSQQSCLESNPDKKSWEQDHIKMQMLEQRDEWSAIKPWPGGGDTRWCFNGQTPAKSLTYRAGLPPEFDLEKKIRAPRERERWWLLLAAEEVRGPILKLWKVSRMDMGAYMCIARYVFILHHVRDGMKSRENSYSDGVFF